MIVGIVSFLALCSYWLIAVGVLNGILITIVLSPWFYVVYWFSSLTRFGDLEEVEEIFQIRFFFPNGYDNF